MIYITGDTHGTVDWHKLNHKNFPEGRKLTKEDYVIVCGDFGAVWDNGREDKMLRNWYSERGWTTLFVDGNHENHDELDKYEVEEWNGGKIHRIAPSVIHLMRGQVYTIDGKTFFTMGGAQSTDKYWRKEGKSWWAREIPSSDEFEEGFRNLKAHGNKVNYVLSHAAPDFALRQVTPYYEHDIMTNYLEATRLSIEFDHWYCGHYHIDEDYGKFSFLYQRVVKENFYED